MEGQSSRCAVLPREPAVGDQVPRRLRQQEGRPGSCSETAMPGPGPRPGPRRARRPETYEAKCERRQEARESRRWRPNMTTCRLAEKAVRVRRREQLQGARQRQLLVRRRLDGPEVASSEPPGSCSGSPPTQPSPPTGVRRDLAGPQPPKMHRGTQTLAEAAKPPSRRDVSQQTNYGVAVLDQEIVQLSEYLKEALQRELVLKQKMTLLQGLLATLLQASHSSWTGQLNEDKLRGRLHALEGQLRTCTQKASPGGLKKALLEMEQQRSVYELKAKASLQKVLEEKLAAEQQLQHTQRSLALAEQQCAEWRARCEALQAGSSHGQRWPGEPRQLQAAEPRPGGGSRFTEGQRPAQLGPSTTPSPATVAGGQRPGAAE